MQIEVYARDSIGAVVRMPGRRTPGLVIEGDMFCIMFQFSSSLLQAAQDDSDEQTIQWAQELKDMLYAQLHLYEDALKQHDLELPYPDPLTAE